jgi:hypothetical protein
MNWPGFSNSLLTAADERSRNYRWPKYLVILQFWCHHAKVMTHKYGFIILGEFNLFQAWLKFYGLPKFNLREFVNSSQRLYLCVFHSSWHNSLKFLSNFFLCSVETLCFLEGGSQTLKKSLDKFLASVG